MALLNSIAEIHWLMMATYTVIRGKYPFTKALHYCHSFYCFCYFLYHINKSSYPISPTANLFSKCTKQVVILVSHACQVRMLTRTPLNAHQTDKTTKIPLSNPSYRNKKCVVFILSSIMPVELNARFPIF